MKERIYPKDLDHQAGHVDVLARAGRIRVELAPEGAESRVQRTSDQGEFINMNESLFCNSRVYTLSTTQKTVTCCSQDSNIHNVLLGWLSEAWRKEWLT